MKKIVLSLVIVAFSASAMEKKSVKFNILPQSLKEEQDDQKYDSKNMNMLSPKSKQEAPKAPTKVGKGTAAVVYPVKDAVKEIEREQKIGQNAPKIKRSNAIVPSEEDIKNIDAQARVEKQERRATRAPKKSSVRSEISAAIAFAEEQDKN